jgi:nucleotide-binding universal stress UspA family protein
MFDRILVPVDLTDRNFRALGMAARLAGEAGEVTLLHVIEMLDLPFDELEDFYQRLHDRAQTEMDRMVASLSESDVVPVLQRICYGNRLREILAFATENDSQLIVMSSRRLDPAEAPAGFATLSHQLAMLSQVPVLLVK